MPTCDLCGTECVHTSEGWFACPECDTICYIECDHCNGYGSSLKEHSDRCSKCGGSGVVKPKEGEVNVCK